MSELQNRFFAVCDAGDVAQARLLVEKGAEVNRKQESTRTVLHDAAYFGRRNLVQFLLSLPQLDPNIQDEEGYTALQLGHDNEEITSLLLHDQRVDASIADDCGRTSFWWAIYCGMETIVDMHVASGKDLNLDQVPDRMCPEVRKDAKDLAFFLWSYQLCEKARLKMKRIYERLLEYTSREWRTKESCVAAARLKTGWDRPYQADEDTAEKKK